MKPKFDKTEICRKSCFVLLFFCLSLFVIFSFFENFNILKFATANANQISENFEFKIYDDGKVQHFFENDFNESLSNYQKEFRKGNIHENLEILEEMGFSRKEAINYVFPEVLRLLNVYKQKYEKQPTPDKVVVEKNACNIHIEKGINGRFVCEDSFYQDVYDSLKYGKVLNISIILKDFSGEQISPKNCSEKSSFTTNFETSSAERKNNIKVALAKFDGIILENGETLSFNTVTGSRNAEAGYLPAKIISGGTFVEGFGGGVCQVSTTLYNACLLAGLEILEVHNHSLPVSYIEPSFDAMVNTGSSDLVIKNNTGERLIITTSSKNDKCKVKIFGKPNEFKITRFSEKTKIIPATIEECITDESKVNEFNLKAGEEKRISYAKDGFSSNGYLNYYDKNGNIVKTKKIRSNTYNPTKGVVVKKVA